MVLGKLVRTFRQLASGLNEKPRVEVDDYILEHFLLYHGLVGSSPENQRDYKDVRADILSAIKKRSSFDLAVALKIQPLFWEDKLKKILSEVKVDDREGAIATLMPPNDDGLLPPSSDPLRHEDWRVRANAANILAFLEAREAVDRMVAALGDTVDNGKAAFCHVAYAVGRMGSERSRELLSKFTGVEEPWFRVDVAGALAQLQIGYAAETLAEAILIPNPLSDYVAVAVARKHNPHALLSHHKEIVQDAGCAIVTGLIQAASQTFSREVVEEARLHECYAGLVELAKSKKTPLRLKAVLTLIDWMQKNPCHEKDSPMAADLDEAKRLFVSESPEALRVFLKERDNRKEASGHQRLELQHCVRLIGELGATGAEGGTERRAEEGPAKETASGGNLSEELSGQLLSLLDTCTDSEILCAVVDSLAALKEQSAAPKLAKMVSTTISIEDRTGKNPSKQPLIEDADEAIRLYWHILKAFSRITSPQSVKLLLQATSDYAPDKREQALASLIALHSEKLLDAAAEKALLSRISEGLKDSSPPVRVAALAGADRCIDADHLIPEIVRLTDAKEISVARASADCLARLSARGRKAKVQEELQNKLRFESNQYKKDKLSELIARISKQD